MEAFGRRPEHLVDQVFRVPKLDRSGFRLELWEAGMLVLSLDEDWEVEATGLRYTVTMLTGPSGPLRFLNPIIRRRERGKLSKQGSPHLRWALVQAAQQAARRSAHPDYCLYVAVSGRIGAQRAALTTARKIAKLSARTQPSRRSRAPPEARPLNVIKGPTRMDGRAGALPVARDTARLSSSGMSRLPVDPI